MEIQNSKLLLLKDLIEITTEKVAMELLYKKLKGVMHKKDISHTILEITGLCPLCDGNKKINNSYCPSCMDDLLRYKKNRINRYNYILNVVPEILQKILK